MIKPLAVVSLLTLVGCGGHSFLAGGAQGKTAAELRPGVWNELTLAGDTRCAAGGAYSFWVHPGTTQRVVVDFMGGGACWDEATCRGGDFTQDVDGLRQIIDFGYRKGIYDLDNPKNPFGQDWYVLVPYCTGDIHWGDATVRYGEGAEALTVHHKGAVNSRAVLAWVEQNFKAPERLFVTGCSAGAYGSALWSSHLMKHYEGVPVVQFGDSGAGVITKDFFKASFPSWKAEQAFPSFIEALDPAKTDLRQKSLADLYIEVAKAFPNNRMSQFNRTRDESQLLQFTRMGGTDPNEWTRGMLASVRSIDQVTENFASFSYDDSGHCATLVDDFYEVKVGDVQLVDWLRDSLEKGVPSVGP